MINELKNYLDNSRSAFNAVSNFKEELLKNKYIELKEFEDYKVKKGGKYFVVRNNSSIIAFNIGKKLNDPSLHVSASHTDCPSFKLKPNSLVKTKGYLKLNTEPYGGMLMTTWFDRPLGLCGRVIVKDKKGLKEVVFDSKEMFCLIPSVAPHLTRDNGEGKMNAQIDLLPLVGLNLDFTLEDYLSKKLNIKKEDVSSYDLYLYPCMTGEIWSNGELLSSHHTDNLESAFLSFKAFLNNFNDNNINVFSSFDNEEVGSLTRQGAYSDFLLNNLKRVSDSLNIDYYKMVARGMMLSIDNAHAIHPNHPELTDNDNGSMLNGGIVIKTNARQSYVSDSLSIALFKEVCNKAGAKYQYYANRSDIRGGSTLGNLSNSNVSLISIDIGLASLAMHSTYETVGTKDIEDMYKAVKQFYSSHLKIDTKGNYTI